MVTAQKKELLIFREACQDAQTIFSSHEPALLSDEFDNKDAFGMETWVEYDVTALVTGAVTYTFALTADGSDGVTFSSREGIAPP